MEKKKKKLEEGLSRGERLYKERLKLTKGGGPPISKGEKKKGKIITFTGGRQALIVEGGALCREKKKSRESTGKIRGGKKRVEVGGGTKKDFKNWRKLAGRGKKRGTKRSVSSPQQGKCGREGKAEKKKNKGERGCFYHKKKKNRKKIRN